MPGARRRISPPTGAGLRSSQTRRTWWQGDTNHVRDVFVRDNQSGAVVRVSVSSFAAEEADGPSEHPSISSNGRFVAFASTATNLAAGDVNGVSDIYRHDRDTDADGVFDEPGATTTRLASGGFHGLVGNGTERGTGVERRRPRRRLRIARHEPDAARTGHERAPRRVRDDVRREHRYPDLGSDRQPSAELGTRGERAQPPTGRRRDRRRHRVHHARDEPAPG